MAQTCTISTGGSVTLTGANDVYHGYVSEDTSQFPEGTVISCPYPAMVIMDDHATDDEINVIPNI